VLWLVVSEHVVDWSKRWHDIAFNLGEDLGVAADHESDVSLLDGLSTRINHLRMRDLPESLELEEELDLLVW
jgi:hypothetical protein